MLFRFDGTANDESLRALLFDAASDHNADAVGRDGASCDGFLTAHRASNVAVEGGFAWADSLGQLMNPSCVLIAQFRNDGWITLSGCVLNGGSYVVSQLTTLFAGPDKISFTFGVDVGPVANKPLAGLLVERADTWGVPWDDEVAHVLGGNFFPFGADPVPVGGSIKPTVGPQATLGGTFTGPVAGGAKSELTIVGISRTSKTTIIPLKTGTRSKSLSLWLPKIPMVSWRSPEASSTPKSIATQPKTSAPKRRLKRCPF